MSKAVLFLLFLSLMVFSEGLGQRSKRVIGGRDAKQGEVPYVLALEVMSKPHMGIQCSYTLINDKTALGTAHCIHTILHIWNVPLSHVSLSGGNIDRSAGEILHISTVNIHKYFTYHPVRNDISTVILKKPIRNKFRMKPIALAAPGSNFVGKKAKVAGWGRVEVVPGSPHNTAILKVMDLLVIPQDRCAAYFPNAAIGFSLCAAGPQGVTTPGDSGSPLIANYKSKDVMIAFEHSGYSEMYTPSLFVAISSFIQWIQQNSVGEITLVGP